VGRDAAQQQLACSTTSAAARQQPLTSGFEHGCMAVRHVASGCMPAAACLFCGCFISPRTILLPPCLAAQHDHFTAACLSLLPPQHLHHVFHPNPCSAPPDAFISWPIDSHASSGTSAPGDDDDEPDLVSVTRLPPGPEAYSFLAAHSAPDEPEMLSGLCLYTEVFLSKVRCCVNTTEIGIDRAWAKRFIARQTGAVWCAATCAITHS
jgi:hypothetical protein